MLGSRAPRQRCRGGPPGGAGTPTTRSPFGHVKRLAHQRWCSVRMRRITTRAPPPVGVRSGRHVPSGAVSVRVGKWRVRVLDDPEPERLFPSGRFALVRRTHCTAGLAPSRTLSIRRVSPLTTGGEQPTHYITSPVIGPGSSPLAMARLMHSGPIPVVGETFRSYRTAPIPSSGTAHGSAANAQNGPAYSDGPSARSRTI